MMKAIERTKRSIVNTKRMIVALTLMLTACVSASAMSYEQARKEALFLTDKMAYELNLTDAQYEAAYEINLDYLMGVTSYNDVFGVYWERRNLDMSYILYSWQWDAFCAATYFYRPLYWEGGYWHFGIYSRYPRRDYFFFGRPHFYATYRGGHSWHLNGGHSFYHGRESHFRPALGQNRQHIGMRNSFDRGDFRGSRAGSSTRITGRRDGHFDGNGTINRNGGSRGSFNRGNSNGNFNRGNSNGNFNRENSNVNGNPSGSSNFNRGNGNGNPSGSSNFNRGNGNGNPSGSSNFNRGNSNVNNRPSGSSNPSNNFNRNSSSPSRSIGGSSNRGSMPSRSVGSTPSRHVSGSSSSSGARSSNNGGRNSTGGGHFNRNHR